MGDDSGGEREEEGSRDTGKTGWYTVGHPIGSILGIIILLICALGSFI
jgi:hypothetical protein